MIKSFVTIVSNCGNTRRFYYSITEADNASLLGVRNYVFAISLLIFIEQEAEIIISYRYQYNKWGYICCPNSRHVNITKIKNKRTSFPEPILMSSRNCVCITATTDTNRSICYTLSMTKL